MIRKSLLAIVVAAALSATATAAASTADAGTKIVPLSAGTFHTCGLTPSGGAMCWGAGGDGALGNGLTSDSKVPVGVTGLGGGVAAIAAGWYHTCALTTGGAVSCWGDNTYGQLGDGSTEERPAPVPVAGLSTGVAAIAAGGFHTCALMEATGGVKCWGSNSDGQLGRGTFEPSDTPVDVPELPSQYVEVFQRRREHYPLTPPTVRPSTRKRWA